MNTTHQKGLPRWAAALLNLTGLSLGYFFLRRFGRGGICLAITLGLSLFAFFTPGLHIGTLMVIALAVWQILMALDGWRLAAQTERPALVPVWAGLLVALAVLTGLGAGFSYYYNLGQQQYATGERLYAESQYGASRTFLQSFTNTYHLSLNPNLGLAEERIRECEALSAAAETLAGKQYEQAIGAYQDYLTAYPQSSKQTEVRDALGQASLAWAGELQASGKYSQAIAQYETLLKDYPSAPASAKVHEPLGEAHMQQAAALYTQGDKQAAMGEYRLVIKGFADTPYLGEARTRVSEILLELARQEIADKKFLTGIHFYEEILAEFDALPAGATAKAEVAEAHLAAGEEFFANQQYDLAMEHFNSPAHTPATRGKAEARAAEIFLIYAKEDMQEKRYTAALLSLETVLSDFSATPSAAEARRLAAEVHLAVAEEFKAKGSYEQALKEYDIVLKQFATTPSAAAARSASGSVRMEVAALYLEQGKYRDAAGLYQLILRDYSGQPETAAAGELLPAVYLDWARQLLADKLYSDALDKLNIITQSFATSTAATQVASVTVDINVAWGAELVNQGQYIQAIEKLDTVRQGLSDPALQQTAKEAYEAAVQALAKDTGTQGKQVIEETFNRACEYTIAASPAVGILPGKVYGVMCGNSGGLWLDNKYYPKNPGNFYYAIFVTQGTNQIESCPYTGGRTVIRQQPWTQITIRSVTSMGVVAQNSFTGGMPEKCNYMEWFTSSTKYKVGSYPNSTTMLSWIAGYLNP